VTQFNEVTDKHSDVLAVESTGSTDAQPAATAVQREPIGRNQVAELERLGDEIAELAAHLHAATYRLLVMLREFDELGGWGGGFRSCAHWLSWRTGIALGAAREKVRVARALQHLPRMGDAMRQGQLSFAKVRACTRVATRDNEAQLLELARQGTASHLERILRGWRRVDRLEEQYQEQARHEARDLTLFVDDDGTWVLRGRLDPEAGAVLERALSAATEALCGRRRPVDPRAQDIESAGIGQRRADAIGLIAECALRAELAPQAPSSVAAGRNECMGGDTLDREKVAGPSESEDDRVSRNGAEPEVPGQMITRPEAVPRSQHAGHDGNACRSTRSSATAGRANRFLVVVHVDAEALRETSDVGQSILAGAHVSAETARRIACDCSRVVMVQDAEGRTVDVGRKMRAIPPAIRRALEHRDQGCRFPGCGLRICDAHHLKHWGDGGATRLSNLMLVCRRHHRALHEGGFRVVLSSAGEFTFYRPDGRPLPDSPALPRAQDAPATLDATHRALGLGINASTALSGWRGERLDLHYAIRTLRR
jgi:hypothetical protein